MKHPLTIFLAALAALFAGLTVQSRVRARHEAELWAEATAEPLH